MAMFVDSDDDDSNSFYNGDDDLMFVEHDSRPPVMPQRVQFSESPPQSPVREVSPSGSGRDSVPTRPAIKRTLSRRGAIGFSGVYLMGSCEGASYSDSRGYTTTDVDQLTSLSMHSYQQHSARKRCRLTVEREDSASSFVAEASSMLENCRVESADFCRALRRQRTNSEASTISNNHSTSSVAGSPSKLLLMRNSLQSSAAY